MFDVGDRIIGLELPDTFYKLAELLEQDQFELLLSKNRIKDMHRKQDISLVYLMNDAVESFLVFHNATITGQYKSEYEGGLLAVLDKKEEEYVLVVHQGDSVITLFFEDLLQQNNLYNYGDIGHFWVKGYEYLRLLEYRLAILRDKCDYLDIDCSTPEERKLAALVEFPPLNYCCYPAVPEKYIVPRQNPWQPSDEAIDLMIEIAKEAGIGRATLFRYFPGKLELVIAVNTKEWKEYFDELDQKRPMSSVGDIPAIGRLIFTLDSFIEMYQTHKALLRYNDNFNHYVSHSGRKDLQMDEFNQALFSVNTRFHMMYEKAKEDKTFKTDMAEEEFMRVTVHTMMTACAYYAGGFIWGSKENEDYTPELIQLKEMILAYVKA